MADTEEAVTGRMAMAARVLTNGTTLAVEAMLPKLFSPATEERCPELVDIVKRTIFFTSPVAIAAAQQGMARRTDAPPEEFFLITNWSDPLRAEV